MQTANIMQLTPGQIKRIDCAPNLFLLSAIVNLKYVQSIGEPNELNFKVGMAGGHTIFGVPDDYKKFIDKYLAYLEIK